MKKISIFLTIIISILTIFACVGCDSSDENLSANKKETLIYNKKYYHAYYYDKLDLEDAEYIIFYEDNTAEYKVSYRANVVKFKYVLTEDTVHCFYNEEPSTSNYNDRNWNLMFFIKKGILYNSSGNQYINEETLEDFPNFG